MNIKLFINPSSENTLLNLFKQHDVETEEPSLLFDDNSLNSGFDIPAIISLVVGGAAFWNSLSTILKDALKKTPIELEYNDKEKGINFKVKADAKNLDEVILKLKELNHDKTPIELPK
jgi:hypothetical protein